MSVLTVLNWMMTSNSLVTALVLLFFAWGLLFKLIRT